MPKQISWISQRTYNQDSDDDDDVREETEEEFLERYAAAAAGESIEIVEDGDIDDETQDIELGKPELFSPS
jgi:hypothetical protein